MSLGKKDIGVFQIGDKISSFQVSFDIIKSWLQVQHQNMLFHIQSLLIQ